MSRVVVTGYGSLSVLGVGREEQAAAFAQSEAVLPEVDRAQGYHLGRSARTGGLVDSTKLSRWLKPIESRRMSPPSRLAVVASRLALEDAGLSSDRDSGRLVTTGVYLATAFGPSSYTERILRQVLLEGPQAASPMLFTESVANAPAAQVALGIGATGPNITVTQREIGTLLAVGMARRALLRGRISRALVGGVDELNPLLHAVLDRFRALVRPDETGREIARPFDRRRSGFFAAEGATVLVLETEAMASERRAPIRAIVGPCVSAFDPSAPAAGWSRNCRELAEELRHRARQQAMPISDLDLIICGASGARQGDAVEACLLRSLFDATGRELLPPVIAPQAWTGCYSGSLLAAAVHACEGGRFAATPGFESEDPELGVQPHDGSELPRVASLLVQSASVGGGAAWLHLASAAGETR